MTTAPAEPRVDLRAPSWAQFPSAARMMATAYLDKPGARFGARTRNMLTWLLAVAFYFNLAGFRPLVRYWVDPTDRRRQIVATIVPGHSLAIPAVRFLGGFALYTLVMQMVPASMPTPVLGWVALVLVLLPPALVVLGLLTGIVLLTVPYDGKIRRAGPTVPQTDLTVTAAASSVRGGMREVRAYLAVRHAGQRLTVRARDDRAQAVYRSLGMQVVTPGCGRMSGIITAPGLAITYAPEPGT